MTVERGLDHTIVNFVRVVRLEDHAWAYSFILGKDRPRESIHYLGASMRVFWVFLFMQGKPIMRL